MGGNVVFGNESAEKINLQQIDRKALISIMDKGLRAISDKFRDSHGLPLWADSLIQSKEFLSGSAFHLFDRGNIPDTEFTKYKPVVGDIDTQVDENMKETIDTFLSSLPVGTSISGLTFLGFKRTDQFITLWKVEELGINVQVDLELVTFKDGKPTKWSQFSHSSAWDDIKEGIKGVFQKYLMRAFQARSAHDVIIQPKTARGKEKVIRKSDVAFSLKGLRQRLEPVLDSQGNHVYKNGMPVYTELDSATADYITDFDILFSSFFGVDGTKQDIAQMDSFVGLIGLMKKYMSSSDQKKVVDGFANILWEKGAQGLVRADPTADFNTKIVAFKYLVSQVGGSVKDYQPMIDSYYKSYR